MLAGGIDIKDRLSIEMIDHSRCASPVEVGYVSQEGRLMSACIKWWMLHT